MHIIRTKKDDKDETYRSECSEGDFTSNAYGTEELPKALGLRHKELKEGNPNARN